MKISIGADHRGFQLKSAIIERMEHYDWLDVGTYSQQRTDYPIYARRVCEDIINGVAEVGVLLCGSGVGMSMAANRFRKIYAASCWNQHVARVAREDDGANVIVIPVNFVDRLQAFEIINSWLEAEFKVGLYQRRLDMIDEE